jgi:hypothetical protein
MKCSCNQKQQDHYNLDNISSTQTLVPHRNQIICQVLDYRGRFCSLDRGHIDGDQNSLLCLDHNQAIGLRTCIISS